LDRLVELTEGYTGADIAAIVNAAAMSAIKEHVAAINERDNKHGVKGENKTATTMAGEEDRKKKDLKISMKHFEAALGKIKKKTTAISDPNLI